MPDAFDALLEMEGGTVKKTDAFDALLAMEGNATPKPLSVSEAAKDQSFNPELHAAQFEPGDEEYEYAFNVDQSLKNRPFSEKVAAMHPIDATGHALGGVWRFIKGLPSLGANIVQQGYYGATGNPDLATKRGEVALAAQGAEQDTRELLEATAGKASGAMQDESALRGLEEEAQLNALAGGSGKIDQAEVKRIQDAAARRDFQRRVENARTNLSLSQGRPVDSGVVNTLYKGLGDMAGEGSNLTEEYSPEALREVGAAPADLSTVENVRTFANPVNLALAAAPGLPGAAKAGGALTTLTGKALQVPMMGLEKATEIIGRKAGSAGLFTKVAGGAATGVGLAEAAPHLINHLPLAAKAAAVGLTLKGAQKIGQALEAQGKEMITGAPSELTSRVAAGRLAGETDLRALAGMKIGNTAATGAATAVGFAPLNAALSEGDPQEFMESTMGAAAFGGTFAALKSNRPILVEASRPVWRDEGRRTLDTSSEVGKKSLSYIQSLSPEAQDRIFEVMGVLQGIKTKGVKGEEGVSQFYPLGEADYNAARDALGGDGPRGRGYFIDSNGRAILNADIHQGSEDLAHTMGHEGGHVVSAILNAAGAKGGAIHEGLLSEAKKGLFEDGKPTEEFRNFIETYNRNFDKSGQTEILKADDPLALEEFLAEQSGRIIAGEGLDFALPQSLAEKIEQSAGRFAAKFLGIDTRKVGKQTSYLNKDEIGSVTEAMRETLRQVSQLPRVERAEAPETPVPETVTPSTPAPSETKLANLSISQADISKAMQAVGIPKKEADLWAAQAQGDTLSDAVANALAQRASQKVPTQAPVPLAQGVPIEPTPAPTAQPLASVTPAVEALGPLTKTDVAIKSAETPLPLAPEAAPLDTLASPQAPETRRNSPILPTPEEVQNIAAQAEQVAVASPEYQRARTDTGRARIARQARLNALLDAIPEDAAGLRRVTDPYGETQVIGEVDPSNPIHQAILTESGLSPEAISKVQQFQNLKGKIGYVDYLSAEKEGVVGEGRDLDFTAEQRRKEYEASTPEERAAGVGKATEQKNKGFLYLFTKLTNDGRPNLFGYSVDKFLSNTRHVLDAAKENGLLTGYEGLTGPELDAAILRDVQTRARNHRNGYKANGEPIRTFPDTGTPKNPDAVGESFQGAAPEQAKARMLTLNAAENYNPATATYKKSQAQARYEQAIADYEAAIARGEKPKKPRKPSELTEKARAQEQEAQALAGENEGYVNPETGETNPLRDALVKNGFEPENVLEPVIEQLRPDLITEIRSDPNEADITVRPSGFDVNRGEIVSEGTPNAKFTAAGFLPEEAGATNSKEFKEWFGDSKIVDKKGDPLIVYHGTPNKFNAFNNRFVRDSLGFHFGLTKRQASGRLGRRKEKGGVMEVYVSVKNPLELKDRGGWTRDVVIREINDKTGLNIPENLSEKYNSPKRDQIIVDALKSKGYDGIIYENVGEGKEGDRAVIAFDPTQIKSATENTGAFDPTNPDIRFLPEETDKLGFYSGLGKIVKEKIPNRASADQIAGSLGEYIVEKVTKDENGKDKVQTLGKFSLLNKDGADALASKEGGRVKFQGKQEGIREEEIDMLGLAEFLKTKDGPVTKQELQDFVKAGGVQLVEVAKGMDIRKKATKDFQDIADKFREKEFRLGVGKSWDDITVTDPYTGKPADIPKELEQYIPKAKELSGIVTGESGSGKVEPPKFSQYQLPGGTNYKEVLLTLPSRPMSFDQFKAEKAKEGITNEETLRQWHRAYSPKEGFKSSHWDEPNVLAHIRQADHVDTQGRKVRLIEEIQSDWHQKGRKEGYASDGIPDGYKIEKLTDDHFVLKNERGEVESNYFPIESHRGSDEYAKRFFERDYKEKGVPDAPFKKTWAELAFKRALRQAVEDGAEVIAWTPGEKQAERYDLSKVYETIDAENLGDGKYVIEARGKGGEYFKETYAAEKLPDVLGKELAEKIINRPPRPTKEQILDAKEEYDEARKKWRDDGSNESEIAFKEARRKFNDLLAEDTSVQSFSGVDLKVGGEGMKGFYDKILPDFVRKYVKKWGGKVEEGNVMQAKGSPEKFVVRDRFGVAGPQYNTRAEAESRLKSSLEYYGGDIVEQPRERDISTSVWSVTITPEMREAVMQGQPMFLPEGKGEAPAINPPKPPVERLRLPVAPLSGLRRDDVAKEEKGPLAGLSLAR